MTVELAEPAYTVDEFAAALGVTAPTVRRWIKRELVTYEKSLTGRYRIPRSAKDEVYTVHERKTA